jgi:hypothetical protein
MWTCRSAPRATSLTAVAISPTARPASSDVVAICCEAELIVPAAWPTSLTTERRLPTIFSNAIPRASRSDCGSTSTVRSPSAIVSAAAAIRLRYAIIDRNAEADSPSSSREETLTVWSTSPAAIPRDATSICPIPRVIPRAMKNAIASAATVASASSAIRRDFDDANADCELLTLASASPMLCSIQSSAAAINNA